MKRLLALLVISFAVVASAQTGAPVRLRWKIAAQDTLRYQTIMDELDSQELKTNIKSISGALGDTSHSVDKLDEMLDALATERGKQRYITTLSQRRPGVVDIVMSVIPEVGTHPDTTAVSGLAMMMRSLSGSVTLRGAVYDSGGIQSFWLKSMQKNLIALLFELPQRTVQVGDSWSLETSLIANDESFICDSARRMNKVTLVEIRKRGTESIAVLGYDISEYVAGQLKSQFFTGTSEGPQKITMDMSYQGLAEFSIDKGRWISYNCIMSVNEHGFMAGGSRTRFSLSPR